MSVLYEGFFVIDELNHTLKKDIEFKHITTEFKPTKTHEYLYGKEAIFIVTGYGNNNINEGYSVSLISCDNNELIELINNITIPHITLSVSLEGKPVNTAKLDFKPTNSFKIRTRFGGFIGKPIFEGGN